MLIKIKKIKITIFAPDPERKLSNGIENEVIVDDNSSIIELLSTLDKITYKDPKQSIFPLYKGLIYSYLQLIWDAEDNIIYDDCAVSAYGPNKEFMPLHEDISFNLYPNSDITIVVHAD